MVPQRTSTWGYGDDDMAPVGLVMCQGWLQVPTQRSSMWGYGDDDDVTPVGLVCAKRGYIYPHKVTQSHKIHTLRTVFEFYYFFVNYLDRHLKLDQFATFKTLKKKLTRFKLGGSK